MTNFMHMGYEWVSNLPVRQAGRIRIGFELLFRYIVCHSPYRLAFIVNRPSIVKRKPIRDS